MKQEMMAVDVLVVGGGIAGMMAAIRASELGAKVIVAEKGNTLRSGGGATGNDHFMCYIPEIHGSDLKVVMEGHGIQKADDAHSKDTNFLQTWMEKTFDIVKLWDTWGIPMKYKGKYEFSGHALPGLSAYRMRYSGKNQKPILTSEALKRGVKIVNRVMVFNLLSDEGLIGAIGIDTREDRVVVFKAKTVVLGTGRCARLYPSPTPGWMFNTENIASNTGDGRAMAYRAGAELAELELPSRHSGPKYFCHGGKGTWVGVLRDPQGKPVGPFVTKPDRRYGDPTVDIYTTIFEDYAKSGRGPVYMDCTGISGEDYEYMMHWLNHESNNALIFKEEGIDVREHPFEFYTYEMRLRGGVYFNEKGETSIKGLYAAGDVGFPTGISGAAIFGWIAGENAAKYAKGAKSPEIEKAKAKIEETKSLVAKIRSREVGANWKEFNIALQQIMYDYADYVRSQTLLAAGLSYLEKLRERADTMMMAENQLELMHCLETLDLLDLGELLFIMANERKETRGRHTRSDYPFTNPLLGKKLHIVKRIDGKPVTEWREIGK